ncbi:MAG: spore maturation protein [Bacilli bacterium]|nr:spore maturation protein [Bacilli bacterium]
MLNDYMIPIIVVVILGYGFFRKCDIYESFIAGAVDGLKICVKIIPTVLAMIFAVNIFIGSSILTDMFKMFNSDILPMIFLRPISGNASIAVLNNILKIYGPDSNLGLLASVIQGATDTTVYVIALYFGSVGIKNSRYALPVGLFADFCGIVAAFVVVSIFF